MTNYLSNVLSFISFFVFIKTIEYIKGFIYSGGDSYTIQGFWAVIIIAFAFLINVWFFTFLQEFFVKTINNFKSKGNK